MNKKQQIFYSDDGENLYIECTHGIENSKPYGKTAKVQLDLAKADAEDGDFYIGEVVREVSRETGCTNISSALMEVLPKGFTL